MDELKQTQKGGDNSVQNQIGTQIIVGVDEKRVREICDEKIAFAIQDLSLGASDLGRQRIGALTDKVIEKIKKAPSNLNAFSDPSFQRDIIRAQIAAAESDREPDIETLSELLLARMREGLKRTTKTCIRKAMEIVPEVEDTELMALSVLLFYAQYNLKSICSISTTQYLSALNNVFSKLLITDLPQGKSWLRHLAILDAVIIDTASHFVPMEDYYAQKTTGIICLGIAKDSQNYEKALEELKLCGVGTTVLVDNELMPGFVRLPITDLHDLSVLPLHIQNIPGGYLPLSPAEGLLDCLKKVIALYDNDQEKLSQVKKKFLEKMTEYKSIMQVKNWLATVGCAFELTSVGEALAYVNARRCIPELPVIELK